MWFSVITCWWMESMVTCDVGWCATWFNGEKWRSSLGTLTNQYMYKKLLPAFGLGTGSMVGAESDGESIVPHGKMMWQWCAPIPYPYTRTGNQTWLAEKSHIKICFFVYGKIVELNGWFSGFSCCWTTLRRHPWSKTQSPWTYNHQRLNKFAMAAMLVCDMMVVACRKVYLWYIILHQEL